MRTVQPRVARSEAQESDQMRMRGMNNSIALGVPQIFAFVLWSAATSAAAEAAAPPLSPTNIFAPVSTPAKLIFGLSIFVLAVTAAIFVVVFTLLAYSVVKFRKRANDDGREPPQVYGSNQVAIAWTILPVLVVLDLVVT